nr:probable serine hydrolase [Penaeus vannamei]XP_027212482.1 probable serine hydrolase [Penaeus vannamei]XP_027212483.1 probable serine hydrolase [Penaeus vannamei]XP_027212485.1 probable serine hydrolase [Penaeus vannamei]XP_027212486.1 probable serine hydrolase [Penaeus vannamei]XP_027212487.1 probable serine hydrolase [Penaeus vannamei]XP_027212488.1 probable serine hydrolase [Penaeus vannamei]XP_027212489.1 probable serine hydrolase [Penaeus vannamei]
MAEVIWRPVSVDVGWGTLRGKTCTVGGGDAPTLRVVAVHGWLDNANSFDTLVPLLPAGVEVLALDLPGHGLSDHLPPGAHYNLLVHTFNLRTALQELGWGKAVLMAHSMGAAVAVLFAALFPGEVLALVQLDFIQRSRDASRVTSWRTDAATLFRSEEPKDPPAVYTEQEALDRLVASRKSLNRNHDNIDAADAKVLLPRAAARHGDGFLWRHDPRVRATFNSLFGGRAWLEVAAAVRCPVLLVVATKGMCVLPRAEYKAVLDAYRKHTARLDYRLVEGAHHVHLSHPERVAPEVGRFLRAVARTGTSTSSERQAVIRKKKVTYLCKDTHIPLNFKTHTNVILKERTSKQRTSKLIQTKLTTFLL